MRYYSRFFAIFMVCPVFVLGGCSYSDLESVAAGVKPAWTLEEYEGIDDTTEVGPVLDFLEISYESSQYSIGRVSGASDLLLGVLATAAVGTLTFMKAPAKLNTLAAIGLGAGAYEYGSGIYLGSGASSAYTRGISALECVRTKGGTLIARDMFVQPATGSSIKMYAGEISDIGTAETQLADILKDLKDDQFDATETTNLDPAVSQQLDAVITAGQAAIVLAQSELLAYGNALVTLKSAINNINNQVAGLVNPKLLSFAAAVTSIQAAVTQQTSLAAAKAVAGTGGVTPPATADHGPAKSPTLNKIADARVLIARLQKMPGFAEAQANVSVCVANMAASS